MNTRINYSYLTQATTLQSPVSSFKSFGEQRDSCSQIKNTISFLNTTIPLLWLVVGTITNGLSLIVFSRKTMRKNSTFFYLAVMTLSDFIVIWICSLRDFLVYKFHFYISGSLLCKIHVFVFFVSCQFSSWLLAAANFDRLIYVVAYQNSKTWCTKHNAIRVSCFILFMLIILNFHFLIFVESEIGEMLFDSNNQTIMTSLPNINPFVYPLCTLKKGFYVTFYNKYYSWIDAFVFSFIPFLIMSVCNIALIHRVSTTKRNIYRNTRLNNSAATIQIRNRNEEIESQVASRKVSFEPPIIIKSSSNGELSPIQHLNVPDEISPFLSPKERSSSAFCLQDISGNDKTKTNYESFPETVLSTLNTTTKNFYQNPKAINSAATSLSDASSDKMRNLAFTIIGVTFLFILFTLPINIYIPITASLSSTDENKCDDLIFCILNNTVNANHSINFFIYLFTNSKFKKEIKLLFQKIKRCSDNKLNFIICCLSCGYFRKQIFENNTNNLIDNEKSRNERKFSGTSFAVATFQRSRNSSLTNHLNTGTTTTTKSYLTSTTTTSNRASRSPSFVLKTVIPEINLLEASDSNANECQNSIKGSFDSINCSSSNDKLIMNQNQNKEIKKPSEHESKKELDL